MTRVNPPIKQWTRKQAIILAFACLFVGIAGGWFIPRSQHPPASVSASASGNSTPSTTTTTASQTPGPAQMKEMADGQAAPLLEKLKSQPDNPDLLISIGNLYYDAQQYPLAVEYYGRALKIRPSDAAVRTDMATADWYMGKADLAIAEFNKALAYAPDSPNALFNLGIVKWKGKTDVAGAVADWQKLLASNPSYERKAEVEKMIAEAQKGSPVKPGTGAK